MRKKEARTLNKKEHRNVGLSSGEWELYDSLLQAKNQASRPENRLTGSGLRAQLIRNWMWSVQHDVNMVALDIEDGKEEPRKLSSFGNSTIKHVTVD